MIYNIWIIQKIIRIVFILTMVEGVLGVTGADVVVSVGRLWKNKKNKEIY